MRRKQHGADILHADSDLGPSDDDDIVIDHKVIVPLEPDYGGGREAPKLRTIALLQNKIVCELGSDAFSLLSDQCNGRRIPTLPF